MIGIDIPRQLTVSGVDEVEEEDALFFDFLDDEVDLKTNIDGVEFEKSTADQEFNHQDFTF